MKRCSKTILFSLLLLGFCSPVIGSSFISKPDSIQLFFDHDQLVLPGESFRIGVVSYYRNGRIKKTVGMDGGSVWWLNYRVEVSGGTDFSGRIDVNEELIPSKGKYIGIKAWPRKQPELMKELLIPLNYETKITYCPTTSFDKAPGSQVKGKLVSEFDNGIQRVCTNLRNSKESGYFHFVGDGGSWKNGKFIIDPDFTKIDQHRSSLIVNSLRNRLVADTFAIQLDYKHAYKLQFNGSSGMSGFSGADGVRGSAGTSGSDGQNGQNGEFGSDGPDVGIWVDLYRDSLLNTNLLYVYAQNLFDGEESRYLINPEGGCFEVSSNGGSGGSGGAGGSGGDGGNGLDGQRWIEEHIEKQTIKKPVIKTIVRKEKKKQMNAEGQEYEVEVDVEVTETIYVDEEIEVVVKVEKQGPGGDGGEGGWGGAGGLGGGGGYGGNITLYFTDDARPYQHLFVARSGGGSGGVNGSGGHGGRGGSGGNGNPDGRSGSFGQSGPYAVGWAGSGGSGQILVRPTEEFFYYSSKEQAFGK